MGWFDSKKERRRHQRFEKNITVQIKHRTHKVDQALSEQEAAGQNISLGGLCFHSPVPYEPGSRLDMMIRVSDWERDNPQRTMGLAGSSLPITATGEVVRCQSRDGDKALFEIGLKFVDIFEGDYKKLAKYLGVPLETGN